MWDTVLFALELFTAAKDIVSESDVQSGINFIILRVPHKEKSPEASEDNS